MKRLILCFILLWVSYGITASSKDQISLVVIGSAPTRNEAVSIALRSAIEQAFGAFISSSTKVVNDELMSDEIVSVSSGNIKKYSIISEIQGESDIMVTLNATVSLSRLSDYMTQRGVECSFDGHLLAENIRMMRFRADNTAKCLDHLLLKLDIIHKELFEFKIDKIETPFRGGLKRWERGFGTRYYEGYLFPVTISCWSNKASCEIRNDLYLTLKQLSLLEQEIVDYENFVGVTKLYNYFRKESKVKTEEDLVLPGDQSTRIHQIEKMLKKAFWGVELYGNGVNNPTRTQILKHDIIYTEDQFNNIKKEKRLSTEMIKVLHPRDYFAGMVGVADYFERGDWWAIYPPKRSGALLYRIIVFVFVEEADLDSYTGVTIDRN